MQAQVFPYMPPSVLCELGDQQRLRMLTARVGSPKDLVNLNRVLGHPSLTARGSSPRTRLALILTGYLVQKNRQVGAPRLALPPTLREASPSRNRLTLKVSIDEGPASPSDSSAWQRGFPAGSILLILGPEASRAGSALTFKISARRPLPR
jgi:hypothetical protein